MYPNLMPSNIGITGMALPDVLGLVKLAGFAGTDIAIAEVTNLAEEHGVEYIRDLFASNGLKPGCWWVPQEWRGDEATYQESLQKLAKLAELSAAIGCDRAATAVEPADDERSFDENYKWYLQRLRPMAQALKDHGVRLGIEFKGPKTLRDGKKHEFLYKLHDVLELTRAIGTENVGLVVDVWHVYTAGGDLLEVGTLTNAEVVAVHVNDAPADIPVDELQDLSRAMMLETGRIDVPRFLKALDAIGYDGPISPEPFSKRVSALPPREAALATSESLRRCFQAAGVKWQWGS